MRSNRATDKIQETLSKDWRLRFDRNKVRETEALKAFLVKKLIKNTTKPKEIQQKDPN